MKIELFDQDDCSTYTLKIKFIKVWDDSEVFKIYIDSDAFTYLWNLIDEKTRKSKKMMKYYDQVADMQYTQAYRDLIIFMLSVGEYDPRFDLPILDAVQSECWKKLVEIGVIVPKISEEWAYSNDGGVGNAK